MNTIQQNPIKSSQIKEPEVPTWFYFILGMILVIGSDTTAEGQNHKSDDEVPTEIMVYKNQKVFTNENVNISLQ